MTFTRVEGGNIDDKNEVKRKRAIPESVAEQATQILSTVVSSGTGRAAQIGEFAAGKTGTTENYQDAWFVGFDDDLTVAVWVGYPEGARPMQTEYRGEPVAGGTFPAEIWHDFMVTANKIRAGRAQKDGKGATGPTGPVGRPGRAGDARRDRRADLRPTKSKRKKGRQGEAAGQRQARGRPAEPAPEPGPGPHPDADSHAARPAAVAAADRAAPAAPAGRGTGEP